MKISVLIATRNRAPLLKSCLFALSNQTIKPFEVITIDNDSQDHTKQVCYSFKKTLPIRYQKEKKIGLPFARNTSIQLARGDLCTYIDDDCITQSDWLKQIQAHFESHPQAVGVIGKTENALPNNIASSVEYTYYLRWLRNYISDINKTKKLSSGLCIDFKNAAFRATFIKKFRFSTDVPYGDVGDEDVEIGSRLYQANKNIYYNPSIHVTHKYSTTIQRLFVRNFWNGYANQKLAQTHGIDVSVKKHQKKETVIHITKQSIPEMILFTVFPLASYFGKLYGSLSSQANIPSRKFI